MRSCSVLINVSGETNAFIFEDKFTVGKKYVGENNCVFNRFYYYVVEFRITRYSILIFSSLIGNLTTEN